MTPEYIFVQFLEDLYISYKKQLDNAHALETREYWQGKVSATSLILKHAIREQAEQHIKAIV